jgi:hypothetical protein
MIPNVCVCVSMDKLGNRQTCYDRRHNVALMPCCQPTPLCPHSEHISHVNVSVGHHECVLAFFFGDRPNAAAAAAAASTVAPEASQRLSKLVFPGRAYAPGRDNFLAGDLLTRNPHVQFFAFIGTCVGVAFLSPANVVCLGWAGYRGPPRPPPFTATITAISTSTSTSTATTTATTPTPPRRLSRPYPASKPRNAHRRRELDGHS